MTQVQLIDCVAMLKKLQNGLLKSLSDKKTKKKYFDLKPFMLDLL